MPPRRSRGRKPTPYQARNERAKALGYKSYYDYRIHGNGKLPPGPIKLEPEERARRRGHRGRVDFLGSLDEGDLIVMPEGLRSVERDTRGRYILIHKVVYDAVTSKATNWYLRNLTRAQLVKTIAEEERRGAVFSPFPSLDQRRLVRADETDGGY